MSQDNIATGHSPLDELLSTINDDKQSNLDQLLSAEIMLTTQPSPLIPFNPTMNMITNIPQSNDTLNTQDIHQSQQHQQTSQQRLNEQQQLQQELQRLQWEQGQNQRTQHRIRQRLQSEQQRHRQQLRQEQQRLRQRQQNEQQQRLRRQQQIEQQQRLRQQQQNQQPHQYQRQARNQRLYEPWQEPIRQREPTTHHHQPQQQYYDRSYQQYYDRYQQERLEQEHDAYLMQRSPTYNEFADEILTERETEEYHFNRMTTQERKDILEQEYMNELQGYPTKCALLLPPDHIEKYTQFLQEQLSTDQYEQTMLIGEMEKDIYTEECRRNQELLIQKQEFEEIAFRLQQQLQ